MQRFFRSIAHVELTETQSLDLWEQALTRKRELSDSIGKKVPLQAALIDVLASANLLRLPIVMEYEELRKLQINAATDPLTGLYNRRFFDDYFEKELNRSIRYSHRLALIVFDLHRFKEVNDRYGHPQGDVLLQLAATTLRKSLRTSDYAFRIGGDEFALLLPQTDTEQAAALSRRLRAAYTSSIEPLQLGVSLALDYGLAVYPDDGELEEVLIRVADERLYQLKNGRFTSPTRPSQPDALPVIPEDKTAAPAPKSSDESAPIHDAKIPGIERRRWERVSLATTRAYALIGEGVERTARVLDLGYGGIAWKLRVRKNLKRLFTPYCTCQFSLRCALACGASIKDRVAPAGLRVGCSFVT